MIYQIFKCPICEENMPQYKDETEYDKTMYRCKPD